MKKIIFTLGIIVCVSLTANAQGVLERLGKGVKDATENAVQRQLNKKAEEQVDKAFDGKENVQTDKPENADPVPDASGWTCLSCGREGNTGNFCSACGAKQPTAAGNSEADKKIVANYNKFDFVAGDNIIFEDNLSGEQLGEFPSQWDLIEGEAEIANVAGQNIISIKNGSIIRPLMKDIYNNLGDVFTIEFDYYNNLAKENDDYGALELCFTPSSETNSCWNAPFRMNFETSYGQVQYDEWNDKLMRYDYAWKTTSDENNDGVNQTLDIGINKWQHVSISVNKRAVKVYINDTRIVNIPNMKVDCGWFSINYAYADDNLPAYIRNVRIAQGAVPLYDRMMTDGKFVTYGITFDVGKSIIKDESMGEINRIVKLMTDNPTLKFSVEGHTDNTGTVSGNQSLSEARSKAIVAKLIESGISADRLTSIGRGQNNPIADNNTDEGRAKNRRVEFVKK